MFIAISKVTRDSKKDTSGNIIKDPDSGRNVPGKLIIVEETIRKDEIRSVRSWHKKGEEVELVEGGMCAVYMFGSKKHDQKTTELHLAESLESFNKRIGAIKISNGEKTK